MQENIVIRGVRQNNLKGFDLTLPRNKLIVFTGLSGCGKSSLAFDTLYAEGQRRYVESLSSYARQFLGQMEKPDVDAIDGLSPAISIDQKTTSKNPRSTVGTVTEIHDYLRLLYARVGVPHCPKCGREIAKQTVDQMVDQLLTLPERTRMQLLAPVVRGKKGEHVKILENVVKQGFVRVRIDGEIYDAAEAPALAKQKKHNIEVVVDRLILREDIRTRLTDSLETALSLSGGIVIADIGPGEREMLFSQNLACPDCGISMEEQPRRERMSDYDFGGKRVLLAEDLEFNAEIASEFLAEAGLVTETACNGAEAVEKFGSSPEGYYSLIFMDIQMPVLDGYQAADKIRALDRTDAKTVPIVAMTANAFIEDVKTAKEHGMNGHVAKPLEVRELTAALKKWIPGFKTKNQS